MAATAAAAAASASRRRSPPPGGDARGRGAARREGAAPGEGAGAGEPRQARGPARNLGGVGGGRGGGARDVTPSRPRPRRCPGRCRAVGPRASRSGAPAAPQASHPGRPGSEVSTPRNESPRTAACGQVQTRGTGAGLGWAGLEGWGWTA